MKKRYFIQKTLVAGVRFKYFLILLLLVCIHPSASFTQNFSIKDIEVNRLDNLAPEALGNIFWRPNSDEFLYSKDTVLFLQKYGKEKGKVSLLSLNQLNAACSNLDIKFYQSIPKMHFHSKDLLKFESGHSILLFNLKTRTCEEIFQFGGLHEEYVYDTLLNYLAYPLGNNLFLKDREGNTIQITNDSLPGIVNGRMVYRREFGMKSGMSWSPNGSLIAYYRKNESRISIYPLVNTQTRVAEYLPIRYPMAGMATQETEIWLYKVETGKHIKLDLPSDEFAYHTNLSWTRDGKLIYLQHLRRGQNFMSLRSYSTETGEFVAEILTERDVEYVEPLHPLVFSQKNERSFYYQSARNGYNHIYFYNAEEAKLTQLSYGDWEVREFLGADDADTRIFFICTKENPLERHFYSQSLSDNKITKHSSSPGMHAVYLNSGKDMFIDDFSSIDVPRIIQISDMANESTPIDLLKSVNPIEDYSLGKKEIGTILAGDNRTELYYRMTLPTDFDSTKKYPLVFYVYGGPHHQIITNSWMDRIGFLGEYFAQNDIIFFTIDPRGSEARGAEFEQVIHRENGIPQMEDYLKAVEFLRSKNFVDESRLGITGWSFGGYMTISMMVNFPSLFKAGVAGGPVIDWKLYEVMYGERYMDTPEDNSEGYDQTNLANYAGNLKNDLLIIQGAIDSTVVMQNSLSFIQACIEAGTYVDFFVYPEHPHNVSGQDRVHLTRMISDYFIERFELQ